MKTPHFNITLPWPYKQLSPNARVHHQEKGRYTKAARHEGKTEARQQDPTTLYLWNNDATGIDELISIRIGIQTDNKERDTDNLGAMMKAYQDGIFDWLGEDDHSVKATINYIFYDPDPAAKPRVIYYLIPDMIAAWIEIIPKLIKYYKDNYLIDPA